MRYVVIWTLRRGIIDPPEPVDPEVERGLLRQDYLESLGLNLPMRKRSGQEKRRVA